MLQCKQRKVLQASFLEPVITSDDIAQAQETRKLTAIQDVARYEEGVTRV